MNHTTDAAETAEGGNAPDESKSESENESESDGGMSFEDTVTLETTKDDLWAFISDPENLARCVPGAQEVERVSQRRYTCEIERGISRLTLSVSGEVEMVEMNEPDWILADGNAYDSTTGSEFDLLAAMEMTETDDGTVDLGYTAELSFTGGVAGIAGLSEGLVRSVVESDVDTYFENIRAEVEPTDEE
ncbi:MAG: SRPBCC domain-containing protein [Haloferacaceae archaeon]